MRHNHHGFSFVCQLFNHRQHLANQLGVQRTGGLIHEDNFRLHRNGSGNANPLLLTAAKLAGIIVISIGKANLVQGLFGNGDGFFLIHAPAINQALCHIFQSIFVIEQIVVLENKGCFLANLLDFLALNLGIIKMLLIKI